MSYFAGLHVYNFNHIPKTPQHVDAELITYAVSFVESGRIYWKPSTYRRKILEGPLAFWTWPGERWRYGPVDGTWNNRFVSWKGARADAMFAHHLFPQCMPNAAYCQIQEMHLFKREFENLQILLANHATDDPRVVHAIEGLLLTLKEQINSPPSRYGAARKIKKLIGSVHLNPERDWDFIEEARHLNCTAAHFRRLWKQQAKCSPIQSLQKARINKAASLLRQPELSVEQIARDCGFEHPSYFYRLFQASHGMPPGQYRESFCSLR